MPSNLPVDALEPDRTMSTRNIILTPHHEGIVDALVRSGRYENASEVIREGLRLIEQQEAREAAKLEALREAARIGFDDLDHGRCRNLEDGALDDFIAELGERAAQRVRAAGQ
jgi:antitoxin ParD1/3/4